MSQSSAKEFSSLLISRSAGPGPNPLSRSAIHKDWDEISRATLVILWGLLVYPRLDPSMEHSGTVKLDEVYRLFNEHLGNVSQWKQVLYRLETYDYIRFAENKSLILAGTRLWTAVDAGQMYRIIRSSVLVRELRRSHFQDEEK